MRLHLLLCDLSDLVSYATTRFGPNRPAADIEGNGEFDFWVIYEEYLRIFGEFVRIFGELWNFGEFLTSFGNNELG